MSLRLGDDVGRMLRLFRRSRLRFYGVTVGRFGFGVIVQRWESPDPVIRTSVR